MTILKSSTKLNGRQGTKWEFVDGKAGRAVDSSRCKDIDKLVFYYECLADL